MGADATGKNKFQVRVVSAGYFRYRETLDIEAETAEEAEEIATDIAEDRLWDIQGLKITVNDTLTDVAEVREDS